MLKRKPLSMAISTALGVVTASGVLGNLAYAEDDESMMEEVVVTGSRIKRANIDSASPVVVLTSEEIKARGYTDVGYMLQRMPSMSGSPIGTTTNNGGDGSVRVNLRGLGSIRTLTLVNGKRTVDGGDYQTVPATMIDRVEILKDGASAVYGADAVAGVVNIITRKDYEGFNVEAQTADFFDMDNGEQNTWNFIGGKNFDGGNFMFGAEWVDQKQALQSDAPWDFFQNSWFIYPGGCEKQVTAPYDGTGDPATSGCYPVGSSRIEEGRLKFATAGTFLNEGNGIIPHDGRTYNYAPVNFIQTPYERTNLFSNITAEIMEDVNLTVEMRYNRRDSKQQLAPIPYDSRFDPAYSGTFNGTAYSGVHEDNYYLTQVRDAYNATPDGIATPIPVEPLTEIRRRMTEGGRSFTQEVQQGQVNVALTGEFNDISWEVYYDRGWRDNASKDQGQMSGARLNNALGPSADLDGDGTPECYTDITDASTLIAGCVPMNLVSGPQQVTQEQLNYVSFELVDSIGSNLTQAGFSLAGSAFELPGGEIGWAVGYDYRKENLTINLDSNKQLGQVTGNKGSNTKGGFKVDSFYAELLLPVFDNGTQSLDITAGARSDDFSTFGSDETYQLGVELQVADSVKLRATAGQVFRAPSISEAFLGLIDSFPTYLDPCDPTNGVAGADCGGNVTTQTDTQTLAKVGGNPLLQPETGDTVTAGVVWTPTFDFGDLSLTVDYWKTDMKDVISQLGAQFILDDCYINQVAASCSLITRRTNGTFEIAQILDGPLNVAKAGAEGVDTEVEFGFDTGIGRIETTFLWAHMLDQSRTAFAGSPKEDLTGTYNGSAFAEEKINYTVGWSRDNIRVSYLGEYISELKSPASFISTYTQKVDSQLYHDITAAYSIDSVGLTISGGITNVTDEAPPYIDFGFNASTDPSTYRLFGRGYYVKLSWSPQSM